MEVSGFMSQELEDLDIIVQLKDEVVTEVEGQESRAAPRPPDWTCRPPWREGPRDLELSRTSPS